jgi:hypothetical protein
MDWGRALIRALKISFVTQDNPMDVKTVKKLFITPTFHLRDGSIVLLWSPFLRLLFLAIFLLFFRAMGAPIKSTPRNSLVHLECPSEPGALLYKLPT